MKGRKEEEVVGAVKVSEFVGGDVEVVGVERVAIDRNSERSPIRYLCRFGSRVDPGGAGRHP